MRPARNSRRDAGSVTCKPRVYLVVGSLDRGGTERQVLLLARGLSSTYQVQIFVLGWGSGWLAEFPDLRANVAFPPMSRISRRQGMSKLAFILQSVRIAAECLFRRPDVIQGFLSHGNAVAALAGRLARIEMVGSSVRGDGMSLLAGDGAARIERLVLSKSNIVVCNSRASFERIHDRLPIASSALRYIPNVIDSSRTESCRERVLRPSGIRVLTVANLHNYKGIHHAIRAIDWLHRSGWNVSYTIVGRDEGELAGLRQLVDELAIEREVAFLGELESVHDQLLSHDLFLLPSESEGASNALLEAAFFGLPIVATAVGDSSLLLAGYPRAEICRPGSANSIVSAVLRLALIGSGSHLELLRFRERTLEEHGYERVLAEWRKAWRLNRFAIPK